jgi:internalin A
MRRIVALILVLGLLLAVAVSSWAAETRLERAKAFDEIEKLGGKVTIDEKSPGKPVIGVDLGGTKVTDARLKRLQKALPNCEISY